MTKNNFGVHHSNVPIAFGSKADIYILKGLSTGKKYIVKIMTGNKNDIVNEVNIQNIMSRNGISPKVLSYKDDLIIMEYINGLTFNQYIQRHSAEEIDKIMKKIDKKIDKMHELNVIHGDLTGDNIIIDKQNNVFIIDFGSAIYDPNFPEEDLLDDYAYSIEYYQ